MGIEMYVAPPDGEEAMPPKVIVPGEFATMSDFSSGQRRVLSVHCLENDRGGEVYELDNPGFEETAKYRAVDLAAYGIHSRIALIYPGKSYERDVVTETRKQRHLIFRHAPGAHSSDSQPSAIIIEL